MDNQPEGPEIARLINAGWTPPQVDFAAWRPALAAFNAAQGWTAEAERIGDVERPLSKSDRETIIALSMSLPHAPSDG